jgi:hypothetical protein
MGRYSAYGHGIFKEHIPNGVLHNLPSWLYGINLNHSILVPTIGSTIALHSPFSYALLL